MLYADYHVLHGGQPSWAAAILQVRDVPEMVWRPPQAVTLEQTLDLYGIGFQPLAPDSQQILVKIQPVVDHAALTIVAIPQHTYKMQCLQALERI